MAEIAPVWTERNNIVQNEKGYLGFQSSTGKMQTYKTTQLQALADLHGKGRMTQKVKQRD